MTRGRWLLVAAACIAGLVAGTFVAIVVPRHDDAPDRALSAPPVQPTRVKPAREQPQEPGQIQLRVDAATMRLEARTPDDAGGPPWALRTFEAVRHARLQGRDRSFNTGLCVQLGRIYRGRFGWLDARGTFRPVTPGMAGAPVRCGSRRPDMKGKPTVAFESLVTNPSRPGARVYRTVLWGMAGSAAESGVARLGGHRERLRLSRSGGFLVLGSADARDWNSRADFVYPSGKRGAAARTLDSVGPPGVVTELPARRPHIAARAADPAGGLPWGVAAARSTSGDWCVSAAARVFGDRVGQLDGQLGTMTETSPARFDCSRTHGLLYRKRPLDLRIGSGGDLGTELKPSGRNVRRTLSGRTTITGTALPDVRFITVETPRDVRTIEPTSRTRAFVLVYDGTFPTGKIVVTTTFKDGQEHVDTIPPSLIVG